MPDKDPNTTVSLIQNDDPMKFMEAVADAVVDGGNQGHVPTVLFSHAAITGGFNYAAVLIGPYYRPEADENTTVVDLRPDDD